MHWGCARYSASTRKRAQGFARARDRGDNPQNTRRFLSGIPRDAFTRRRQSRRLFICGAEADGTIGSMELLLVSLASLLAGFVDAIVGGGGLILVPALFAIFPGTHPATLFGVNKSASIWGTAMAAAAIQPAGATELVGPAAGGGGRIRRLVRRRLGGDRGLARIPAQAAALDPARGAGLHPGQEGSGPAPRAPAVGPARSRWRRAPSGWRWASTTASSAPAPAASSSSCSCAGSAMTS